MTNKRFTVPNPSRPGGRKPVELLTDRAKRYRANSPDVRPGGRRACLFCGRAQNVGVHHLDGNESNGAPDNLAWGCKSCNAALAYAFKAHGLGKRTRQYNPRGGGAETLGQYAWAIGNICRHADQARGLCSPSNDPLTLEAVELIRATPAARRRQFAAAAAASRGRSGGSVVPF